MRSLALALALTAAHAVPAAAQDVTIPTAQGEATVPAAPETIAVLDLGAIDTLQALGVAPDAAPDSNLIDHIAEAIAGAVKVGTLQEPNLEALAGVGPDLIVVANRSATQKDAVSQVAPAIDMTVDGANLVADTKARLAAFAQLYGKGADGEALLALLDEKLAAVAAAGEGKGTMLVVLTNGPKMSAYGPGSRFGWAYDVTGLTPAVETLDATANHGDAISHEFIAQANPDWLFVLDRGAAIGADVQSAEATLDSALVKGTTAWTEDQVVYLPASNVYLSAGGYTSLLEILDSLEAALAG
ncbi:ABC transporter substrate-binding protein [Paracoccus sp. S-4012]|uniref:siderophore ABC transporter substrate-binding protein n=1 Tax=Paracoccus sp. S-4012 TaxID=2665648 RepID=UPI0012AF0397|nr:siderophore ABC transporter substrate-binding protein [Paracoccus sp. S-4012]MRX51069.1 ABC transporter substrate-binding protein [Paracoccus sp. S-4012]